MEMSWQMKLLDAEIDRFFQAPADEYSDYEWVELYKKVHRYLDTVSAELRALFEEESALQTLDMVCERIIHRYTSQRKPLKPEKKKHMPPKMKAMHDEFHRLQSEEEYLEFEGRMLEYCETLTPEEEKILMADGMMDMLGMVCDGIRYKRDPHYYEKLVEAGILVEATE